ncbi:MAG TPA: ChaN family lipoprotein [Nitrospiraceae bacterium]|jgi:uncharacterized iron-regulated protein|nr:ChaN family lipoprotein [Nitrospiraceae bacterium]
MLGKTAMTVQPFCMRCHPFVRWLWLGAIFSIAVAQPVPANSAAEFPPSSSLPADKTGSFREWQLLEARTGRAVSLEEWFDSLASWDVIYLGEEHHNRFHVEAALRVLEALIAKGRKPVLAIEMFGWDGQAGLDRYLAESNMTKSEFLEAVRWRQNWGGAYEDYEPLITFAREHQLPVRALNPPRSLVRQVAKHGLAGVRTDPEMARWGMAQEEIVDDAAYREKIVRQLRLCHEGGSDAAYQGMYEASMFRDEAMAKTIVEALRTFRIGPGSPMGPILSYTGGGHIQYQLPVPKRVMRRVSEGVRQLTVYLSSFHADHRDEIQELLKDGIADYIWLTPMGLQGPPRRCR